MGSPVSWRRRTSAASSATAPRSVRSEEHTSELQSLRHLVCSLLLEKRNNGRIVKLTAEGNYLADWGSKGKLPGQFATAHALAIDNDDRIYVADRGNKRIQVFQSNAK